MRVLLITKASVKIADKGCIQCSHTAFFAGDARQKGIFKASHSNKPAGRKRPEHEVFNSPLSQDC